MINIEYFMVFSKKTSLVKHDIYNNETISFSTLAFHQLNICLYVPYTSAIIV